METLESLGSHIAAYPLCHTDAAKAPRSFAFRNRQSVREISTPAAIFPLTGHGRFTFRAQCLHASIIQILHSRLQDGEVVTRRFLTLPRAMRSSRPHDTWLLLPRLDHGNRFYRTPPRADFPHARPRKVRAVHAVSSSQNSFLRWTVDLDHTLDLHSVTRSASAENGSTAPDECSADNTCPPVPTSVNLNGSISVRLLVSESITSATSAVPFYFQPTLGGQDIDSNLSLGSYRDYGFRAPNILLLQERFEHSICGPFGLQFVADQGRVAVVRGDLGFGHLTHSFAGGLTLRAGGFPMVSMMFAWGGPEGHHNIFNMNTSLLGGEARPNLD